MRILYGVCGEGMGHATRTKVTLAHLVRRGHQILIVASDQALRVLRSESPSGVAAAARESPLPRPLPPDAAYIQRAGREAAKSEAEVSVSNRGARGAGEERGVSLVSGEAAKRNGGSLAASGEAAMRETGPGSFRVIPIVGLGMRCSDGGLDLRASLEENARRLPQMMMENARAWHEAEAFRPDIVVVDVEPFAWFYASSHGLPLISIDNSQILPRCDHHDDRGRWNIFGVHADGMRVLDALTVASAPGANHYIVTTFFYPPVKPCLQATTTLIPPILRREVLDVVRTRAVEPGANCSSSRSHLDGDHVLVYKTGSLDDATFLTQLARVPEQRFLAYGLKDPNAAADLPNVTARPYDATRFLADLASAQAVVGNGGMSLMGEALALGKPVYAVPVRGQYEQVMNACYLERLGYGVASETLDPNLLRAFLRNRELHARVIRQTPQHDGNQQLYATLDRLF